MEYIFSVQLVIFSLNMLILYNDKRKFITFPERVQRWIVVPNGLALVFAAGAFVAIAVTALTWVFQGRQLSDTFNDTAYIIGNFEDTKRNTSRYTFSNYRGIFTYEYNGRAFTDTVDIPNKYEDYAYILKINTEKPKHMKLIPIPLENIPSGTALFIKNTDEMYTVLPFEERTIPSRRYSITVDNLDIFSLVYKVTNLVEVPLNGWQENPYALITQKPYPGETTILQWLIRIFSILTSAYTIWLENNVGTRKKKKRKKKAKNK